MFVLCVGTGNVGHTGETSAAVDPTIKLGELLQSARYQEAFESALDLANSTVVNWLCNQLDPGTLFMSDPLPLSQNVILALLQQLGAGLDEVRLP
jgi:enhancer of mRNA-decapping protein 4